jgi:hypothetical protein
LRPVVGLAVVVRNRYGCDPPAGVLDEGREGVDVIMAIDALTAFGGGKRLFEKT